MPIPPDILERWLNADLVLPEGAPAAPGPLTLPRASVTEGRAATPASLAPEAWFISAAQPANRETDAAEDERLNAALRHALGQADIASLPARLEGEGMQLSGALMLGVDRAKALRLGYKRKVWAVLGVFPDRLEVVFTGVNSRER
ncbi:MAG: hypothetical protein H6741_03775 [Alphaproteobacteria bacterium]|nr:hypothetical protein [Alphaproteobacteria bacterium]